MIASRFAAALSVGAVLLAGCGGGGDDTVPETPTQPLFNVEASLAQLLQTVGQFELVGRDPLGNEMRRIYRFVPGVPADPRVPGALGTRVEEWSPALPDRVSGTTYYYTANPFRLMARTLGSSSIVYYTQTAEIPGGAASGTEAEFAQGQEPQSTQVEHARWQVRQADAAGPRGSAWKQRRSGAARSCAPWPAPKAPCRGGGRAGGRSDPATTCSRRRERCGRAR